MRATNSPRRNPSGFTLIELLVVISIIGVLMGLLLGAVQKVRSVGQRTTAVAEINQLDMAATKFKLDFGFNPPQRIRLPGVVPDMSDTTGWQLSLPGTPKRESYDGFRQLLTMFPRWQIGGASATSAPPNTATGLSYYGTLAAADENGLVLEGSQSLVFFLGGPNLQGFTPSGPTSPVAGATSKKGPYYDFVPSRVNATGAGAFLNAYLDPYGTPYAYFSTASGTNYSPSYSWTPPGVLNTDYAPNTPTALPTAFVMRPYQEANGKWVNAGRVQIVSAGKNKKFGPGTVGDFAAGVLTPTKSWAPGKGYYYLDASTALVVGPPLDNGAGDGGDDLANFNGGLQLGVSSN